MGFLTKDDHFEVFWGYHHLRKPPYTHDSQAQRLLVLFIYRNCIRLMVERSFFAWKLFGFSREIKFQGGAVTELWGAWPTVCS